MKKMVLPVYFTQIHTHGVFSSIKTDQLEDEEQKSRVIKVFSKQIIKTVPAKVEIAAPGDT